MSNTGTYKMIDGELVKVSDRVPSLKPFVYFPGHGANDHSGYYSEGLGKFVKSKDHKREILKKKGWAEV